MRILRQVHNHEDEGSLDTAPARANCQVITISVHTEGGGPIHCERVTRLDTRRASGASYIRDTTLNGF